MTALTKNWPQLYIIARLYAVIVIWLIYEHCIVAVEVLYHKKFLSYEVNACLLTELRFTATSDTVAMQLIW